MLQQIVRLVVGGELRYVQMPESLSHSVSIFGADTPAYRIFIFLMAAALFGATWYLVNRTTIGMKLRAVVQDRSIAACFGINSDRIYGLRSEEHTSELQSLMRISYAVFCLKKNKLKPNNSTPSIQNQN